MLQEILIASTVFLWAAVIGNFLLTFAVVRKITKPAQSRIQSGPPVGDRLPSFAADTVTGGRLTVEDFLRRSAVFLFVSSHCAPCISAMPAYAALHATARASGVDVVFVTGDGQADAEQMAQQFELVAPVVVAPRDANAMFSEWKIESTPAYVASFEGTVIEAGVAQKSAENWSALVERLAGMGKADYSRKSPVHA